MTGARGASKPLDVAVVDADLLWRVDAMNSLRPLYAGEYADLVETASRVHPDDPTVVLLGPSTPDDEWGRLEHFVDEHPNCTVAALVDPPPACPVEVLALAPDTPMDSLRDAVTPLLLRMDEGLAEAARQEALEQEERDQASVPPADRVDGTGLVVVVTSAKGGQGATDVAANLAVSLATSHGLAVALVDSDAAFGDIALLLDLPPPTIGALPEQIDGDRLSALTTRWEGTSLDVVLSPRPTDPMLLLAGVDPLPLVTQLAQSYDVVVVDERSALLASGGTVAAADQVLIVTRADLAGLKNAAVLRNALADLLGGDDRLALVVNRSGDGTHSSRAISRALNLPVVGSIPEDHHLVAARKRSRPVVVAHPRSPSARALAQLSRRIGSHLPVRS